MDLVVGERDVLELLATGASLAEVLTALCLVIDEQSGGMSLVYLLDQSGKRLVFGAGPHVPDAWRAATSSFEASPTNSACGAAVSSGRQVIVEDMAASPLFAPWREVVRATGFASAWSTPFFASDGRALGTFAVISRDHQRPDDAQLYLVERAKRMASIAVERHQMEESLRESERRFATAFYSSPSAFTIMRASDQRFMYVNDRFVELFEYSRAEVVGRTSVALGLIADPARRTALWQLFDENLAKGIEAKGRTKSGRVLDLLIWMDRIQILGEDCVLTVACDNTDRKQAMEALAAREQILRVMLDTLPVGVAVANLAGDLILSNPASKRIWGSEVLKDGDERYAKSKGWWHDTGKRIEPNEWGSVRSLKDGESTSDIVDIEAFDGVRKIIRNSTAPIRDADGHITGAVIVNADVTARMTAERELQDSLSQMRALSGTLMRAQDDERRRIAQMLHETTAQDLAAMKMHLARVTRTHASLSEDERAALAESVELADRSMSGVRTLSYLLHPPFLDESGLAAAIRWYAEGFSERSGIKVMLDDSGAVDRLPQDVETALFRVVQEALLNIHHHAESPTASIRLRVDAGRLTLEIEDQGRGMPKETLAQLPAGGGAMGVGVAGMRERLQQLGGTLDIESTGRGTLVRARVPIAARRS